MIVTRRVTQRVHNRRLYKLVQPSVHHIAIRQRTIRHTVTLRTLRTALVNRTIKRILVSTVRLINVLNVRRRQQIRSNLASTILLVRDVSVYPLYREISILRPDRASNRVMIRRRILRDLLQRSKRLLSTTQRRWRHRRRRCSHSSAVRDLHLAVLALILPLPSYTFRRRHHRQLRLLAMRRRRDSSPRKSIHVNRIRRKKRRSRLLSTMI